MEATVDDWVTNQQYIPLKKTFIMALSNEWVQERPWKYWQNRCSLAGLPDRPAKAFKWINSETLPMLERRYAKRDWANSRSDLAVKEAHTNRLQAFTRRSIWTSHSVAGRWCRREPLLHWSTWFEFASNRWSCQSVIAGILSLWWGWDSMRHDIHSRESSSDSQKRGLWNHSDSVVLRLHIQAWRWFKEMIYPSDSCRCKPHWPFRIGLIR